MEATVLYQFYFRIAYDLNTTDSEEILDYLVASNVSGINYMSCSIYINEPLEDICLPFKVRLFTEAVPRLIRLKCRCVHLFICLSVCPPSPCIPLGMSKTLSERDNTKNYRK